MILFPYASYVGEKMTARVSHYVTAAAFLVF